MGLTHVAVKLRDFNSEHSYTAKFLIDTGAWNAMAPASELTRIGIKPVGKQTYELANGDLVEYEYGLAEISFMGEIGAGLVIFGPEGIEPILGVCSLEAAGFIVDPASQAIRKLSVFPLKSVA